MTIQYSKSRMVGGFSVYRASYGEGLMLFTNNETHDEMIPVWVSRFVANQIRKAVELSENEYWETPVLRFAFLDDLSEFNNPVDSRCPDCGKAIHAGIKAWDNNYPIYYSACRMCDWSLEGHVGDYDEHFYHYFPELPEFIKKGEENEN